MSELLVTQRTNGHGSPPDLVRIYVWEWPVRVTHWLVVGAIVVLATTGLLIAHPPGPWLPLATVKPIHSYAAIVFTLSVVSRVGWMFAGNRHSRWNEFIPATPRRARGLAPTFFFYVFRLRKPPGFVGHNPLAGLTYTGVFVLYGIMIATGFALYAASARLGSPMRLFVGLGPALGGLQLVRWVHHGVMWMLLAFAIHHVYSAVLMSQVEANGTVESIFSGYKFVPREDLRESGYRFLEHLRGR